MVKVSIRPLAMEDYQTNTNGVILGTSWSGAREGVRHGRGYALLESRLSFAFSHPLGYTYPGSFEEGMETVAREWFTPGRRKFLLGGLIVVFALGYLIFTSTGSSMVYRLSIGELKGDPTMVGKRVRVGGVVDWESVQRDEEALTLTFTLGEDGDSLPVVYQGVVPDTFDSAPGVTLEGEYTAEGIFQADTILLQCPSKYEAAIGE